MNGKLFFYAMEAKISGNTLAQTHVCYLMAFAVRQLEVLTYWQLNIASLRLAARTTDIAYKTYSTLQFSERRLAFSPTQLALE